ncbi:hypothetical protein PF005_g11603 [Phytophthora fragariae]|uniref:Uncharacterized protein n=1 Tax=Phytophthora fragariae TaxID=53985 RepID=A0A6A3F9N9_9STRA|nr:hypothetical protein PF009_g9656 [Phytophthora fragariae]KAE9009650.1 hypothetical protein PF011_g10179 [Phytophthora fragariae]KAE9111124.1 hypothetical protein PF007_g11597 [Phytophthora fragariae]KAE9111394.1 hypothetical protein PF010_g10820 [Phytophthora fragariae]KAE9144264.1 hypothetical protein PF006_g10791 [Phytophthora fragariae]
MFWSAALDLKTQRPPSRPLGSSYGSFSRSASNSSFHIPQSIPEHQPVSQFTSPLPDQRRVEEYFDRPDTAFARTRASLQLSEHTQTALKLLLQGERSSDQRPKPTQASAKPKFAPDMYSMSKISGYSARQAPMKKLPERTPLLKPLARAHGQEEPNPQENSNEHNYWMQELERRRAGLRRSRRRTCTPMSERATTSPLKVGVVMCSVPLALVLGFVLFVMLFKDGTDASSSAMSAMNNLLGIRGDNEPVAEDRGRIARTFARPPEEIRLQAESSVMALDVSSDRTTLRGSQKEKEADE